MLVVVPKVTVIVSILGRDRYSFLHARVVVESWMVVLSVDLRSLVRESVILFRDLICFCE